MYRNPKHLQKSAGWKPFRRKELSKLLSWMLIFCILVPVCGTAFVLAFQPDENDGRCPHHPEHTAQCGYAAPTPASPCNHVHDETCGYAAPSEGTLCGHVHDAECGYVEAADEVPCDMGCTDQDGDGVIDHAEGCAYTPAVEGVECTHVHDESCGYAAPSEGAPCGHVHNAECGYAEAQPGSPCTFVCEECTKEPEEPKEPETPGETVVASWDWAWEDEPLLPLEWNDSANCYGLGFPGVSQEQPLTADLLAELLPQKVTVRQADGTAETAALTWNLNAIPEEGLWQGRITLTASLPEGYALAPDAPALVVLLDLGEGETYGHPNPVQNVPVPSPNAAPNTVHKFVSNWEYVQPGDAEITSENYIYSMNLSIIIPSNQDTLITKLTASLPKQICCTGYTADGLLEKAGFIPDKTEQNKGHVNLKWNVKEVVENHSGNIVNGTQLTFYAQPVSNDGYLIRVNTNDSNWKDTSNDGGVADTAEAPDVLNLTVTIHEFSLAGHTVQSVNPANTTVNLFDYWVDEDGASGNDLLGKSEQHNGPINTQVPRTTPKDWNKGINIGRLLLFGDGNIHAGFWNKGAGAGLKDNTENYGKKYAGMMGIVKKTLIDGYPVIDTDAMRGQITDYNRIDDWNLCGDHVEGSNYVIGSSYAYTSTDPQNISRKVIEAWEASKNTASLDYLFAPKKADYKRFYEDVKGLFQLDDDGYYYYDMRRNFAEFSEEGENHFILYDSPAVGRTDGLYQSDGSWLTQYSPGNFFPFNKGSEVFTGVDEKTGKLVSNDAVQSNNQDNKSSKMMNHHLGMTVQIDFRQTAGGEINTGKDTGPVPMTFQFSGDDDVWVFIDDVLVLDLGGIHSEIFGTIDFKTGEVLVGQSWKTNGFPYKNDGTVDMGALKANAIGGPTTLKALFEAALGEEEAAKLHWNDDTFASDTAHTLKMFYLERGNYDSSLALRFNLQSQLYQQIKKVDQNGAPVEGVEFELYPAEKVSEGTNGAIECQYTDSNVEGKKPFYVGYAKPDGANKVLATLTTDENGTAQFKNDQGEPFGFADQETQFFILKETNTPAGYRSLPVDIVLYYDSTISMLTVANRWTTGAYACSVSNVTGTGRLTYGKFNANTGNIEQDPDKQVDSDIQENGLAVAIPVLKQQNRNAWQALYGSNLGGFEGSEVADGADVETWRGAVLTAALEQAAAENAPQWYFSWDEENHRLVGELSDLPGLASRYQLNNAGGDMRMVYGMITPGALSELGINADTAGERYAALGAYVQEHGVEQTIQDIMAVEDATTGSGSGFSFLNTSQFNRNFRSLIYIPNEQRELWVMKVDQDGVPRNGAVFGLYNDKACTDPVQSGTTATVDGQDGLLIFSPRDDSSDGHAKVVWADREDQTQYYLKEISAPDGLLVNETVIPVVVGTYSIYADAGEAGDGVSVMAGVGRLTQTMRQYAGENQVDITLRDITAFGQAQPSANTTVPPESWVDMALKTISGTVLRSINLHFGLNAAVDYGLHDVDGGKNFKPFFVTDTGYIRTKVKQNYPALTGAQYGSHDNDVNKDNLETMDLTNLFSLLNVVVVTDRAPTPPETGSLAIRKELTGESVSKEDYTKNFTFTIELTDDNGVPLADDHSFFFWGTDKAGQVKNGDEIVLHHDEEIVIQGLPAGTKFKITEKPESDWHVSPDSSVIEGSIQENVVSFAKFLNSKQEIPEPPETGTLTIRKTVTGTGGDKNKDFTFTIEFTGAGADGEYTYTGSKQGTICSGGTITLKHGESVTIRDLPIGTGYKVEESGNEGYTVTQTGNEGVIQADEPASAVAAFTNDKEGGPLLGTLTIRKTVTGTGGDQNKEFTFKVDLTGADGEYAYDGSKQGTIRSGGTITLKHSQSVTIRGLPAGMRYSVTESNNDGYTVTQTGNEGVIKADESAVAAFTNDKGGDPPVKPEDPDKPPEKPEDPKDPPEDPKDPPEDPKDPPEDPKDPPEDPETPPPTLPDPNDPNAPDRITIEEDGVPKTYIKVWDPEKEEWIWILEEDIPLYDRDTPQTGDDSRTGLWLLLCAASAAGLWVLYRRKDR